MNKSVFVDLTLNAFIILDVFCGRIICGVRKVKEFSLEREYYN